MKHLAILLLICSACTIPTYPPGHNDGYPVTQEQCINLCHPMHVTLYNPQGLWYKGIPESPTTDPACLCGTYPIPDQDDDK